MKDGQKYTRETQMKTENPNLDFVKSVEHRLQKGRKEGKKRG